MLDYMHAESWSLAIKGDFQLAVSPAMTVGLHEMGEVIALCFHRVALAALAFFGLPVSVMTVSHEIASVLLGRPAVLVSFVLIILALPLG
jgi:hypothetical protein